MSLRLIGYGKFVLSGKGSRRTQEVGKKRTGIGYREKWMHWMGAHMRNFCNKKGRGYYRTEKEKYYLILAFSLWKKLALLCRVDVKGGNGLTQRTVMKNRTGEWYISWQGRAGCLGWWWVRVFHVFYCVWLFLWSMCFYTCKQTSAACEFSMNPYIINQKKP